MLESIRPACSHCCSVNCESMQELACETGHRLGFSMLYLAPFEWNTEQQASGNVMRFWVQYVVASQTSCVRTCEAYLSERRCR